MSKSDRKKYSVIKNFFMTYDNVEYDRQDYLVDLANDLDYEILNDQGLRIFQVLNAISAVFGSDAKGDETRSAEFKNAELLLFKDDLFKVIGGELLITTRPLSFDRKISAKKKQMIHDYINTYLPKIPKNKNLNIHVNGYGEVKFTLDRSYFNIEAPSLRNLINYGLSHYEWDIV
jgi:hypothetical protein